MRIAPRYSGAGTAFDYPEAIGFNRQPFASVCVGPWTCCAGPNGVAVGCFGWLDVESGQVTNQQVAGGILVFVLPVANDYNLWERAYINYPVDGVPPFPQEIVRPYVRCGAAVAGVFSPKFPSGAQAGALVYADPATGLPYGENLTGAFVATPYTTLQSGPPNCRLRVSSFVKPVN